MQLCSLVGRVHLAPGNQRRAQTQSFNHSICFPGCGVEIILGHIAIHAVGDCMCGSVYQFLAPGTCQSISGMIKTPHLVLLGCLQEPELLTRLHITLSTLTLSTHVLNKFNVMHPHNMYGFLRAEEALMVGPRRHHHSAGARYFGVVRPLPKAVYKGA